MPVSRVAAYLTHVLHGWLPVANAFFFKCKKSNEGEPCLSFTYIFIKEKAFPTADWP